MARMKVLTSKSDPIRIDPVRPNGSDGQVAGAFYGESGIPAEWIQRLHERDMIGGIAENLLDLAKDPSAFTN